MPPNSFQRILSVISILAILGTEPGTATAEAIVKVKREIYVRNTVPGTAPWVYAFPGQDGYREEIHTEWSHEDQVRGFGDSPQNPRRRVSLDNGKTWSLERHGRC